MRCFVVAVALGFSAPARADSPWVLQAGAGIGVRSADANYVDAGASKLSFGPGVDIDAGYRVHRIAAVGCHLGAQVMKAPHQVAINSFEDETYVSIEAGVSGSIILDRVTLSPWLGLQSLHGKRYRAVGFTGAYDVRAFGHESVTVFASVLLNSELLGGDNWPISDIGVLVGVGYRYW